MTRLVILCVTWMALSALTAYYADIWGRKLGKQRKTLFGWRPKRTAVFIITVSGALIALSAFVALLVADKGIRRALTQWDQKVAQLDRARAEVNVKTAELGAKEAEIRRIETRLQESRGSLARAQALVAAAQLKLNGKQADLVATQKSLREAAQQLARTDADLNQTKYELAQTRQSVAKGKKEARRLQEIAIRVGRVMVKAGQMEAEATARAEAATQRANQALLGKLTVVRSEELLRTVIPPRSTLAQAREAVQNAVNQARTIVAQRAKDRGAAFPPGRPYATIMRREMRLTSKGRPETYRVPEQKIIDAVASQLVAPISPSPGGVVLQVVATENAMAGETVPVDFRLYENHVVFEKGTELARVTLNSRQTKAEVMDGLTNALVQVRTAALKSGLMRTSDDSVGSLPAYQLPDVYSEVQRAFRENQDVVPVHIYAAQDAWTAGPLTLRFKVER